MASLTRPKPATHVGRRHPARSKRSKKPGARPGSRLRTTPYQRLTGAAVDKLPSPVLDVAVARAQGPTWCSYGGPSNAADNGTNWASDNRTSNDTCSSAGALLRRLAGRSYEADCGCKDELPHGASPFRRQLRRTR